MALSRSQPCTMIGHGSHYLDRGRITIAAERSVESYECAFLAFFPLRRMLNRWIAKDQFLTRWETRETEARLE